MSSGEGADTGDKTGNKALTGVYKYAIHQTCCIGTGDDPDEHASDLMERKKPDSVEQAKARPVCELKDCCRDGAAVAAGMKQELAITFDMVSSARSRRNSSSWLLDGKAKKGLRSRLRKARKDGRKLFAGYIKQGDVIIHVLLLADASRFVYRRLTQFEPELIDFLPRQNGPNTTSSATLLVP